jgi:hypothetical protein
MPDTLDPIMQAAERLIRLASGEKYWQVYPVHVQFADVLCWTAECWAQQHINWDQKAVCDAILPKGKRPVAIDVVNLPLKCKVYWPCDTYDGIMHGEVTNMNNHTRAYFRSDDSIRVDAYTSAGDAWLALHWMKLDELIPEEPAPLAS